MHYVIVHLSKPCAYSTYVRMCTCILHVVHLFILLNVGHLFVLLNVLDLFVLVNVLYISYIVELGECKLQYIH